MRRVAKEENNRKLCICPSCPTFPKNFPKERLYCGEGHSKSKIDYWGCICPDCPIFKSHGLAGGYYCSRGKALT